MKEQSEGCTKEILCVEEGALKHWITDRLVESTRHLLLRSTMREWWRKKSAPIIPPGTSATTNVQESTRPLNWSWSRLEPKERMEDPFAATREGPWPFLFLSAGEGGTRLTSAPESTRKRELELLSSR